MSIILEKIKIIKKSFNKFCFSQKTLMCRSKIRRYRIALGPSIFRFFSRILKRSVYVAILINKQLIVNNKFVLNVRISETNMAENWVDEICLRSSWRWMSIYVYAYTLMCLYLQDIMNREKEDQLPMMQVGFIDSICLPIYEVSFNLDKRSEFKQCHRNRYTIFLLISSFYSFMKPLFIKS